MTRGRVVGIGALIVLVVAVIIGFMSIYVVDPTRQALVLRFGQTVQTSEEPGLYFKLPFVDNVVYLEKRLIRFEPDQLVRGEANQIVSLDQRRFYVLAFGEYRIVDPLLFYQSVRNEGVANDRLIAILDRSLRDVLADATYLEIIASRAGLLDDITERVAEQAESIGVQVVDVMIQRVVLPEDNLTSIYSRMQTERQQEAALIRAEGEEAARRIRAAADREVTVTVANANRDANVLRGAGDAEANRIYAEAYGQDPSFFEFYRSMQAYLQGLNADTTTMLMTPDTDFFRYFNQIGTIDQAPVQIAPELLPELPALPDAPDVAPGDLIPPPDAGNVLDVPVADPDAPIVEEPAPADEPANGAGIPGLDNGPAEEPAAP